MLPNNLVFALGPEPSCSFYIPTGDQTEVAVVESHDESVQVCIQDQESPTLFSWSFFAIEILQVFSFSHFDLLGLICLIIVENMAKTRLRKHIT